MYRFGAAASDGETLWTCVTDGASAHVRSTAGASYDFPLKAAGLFSYLAAHDGKFAYVYEGGDDNAYLCDEKNSVTLGPKIGNETVFLEAGVIADLPVWVVYWVPASLYLAGKFQRRRYSMDFQLIDVDMYQVPPQYAPPATGWCDVVNGNPEWTVIETGYQLAYSREGLPIVCPQHRNGFTSGQALRGGTGNVCLDRDGKMWRVYGQDSKIMPRLAVTASGARGVVVSPGVDSPDQVNFSENWTAEPLIHPFTAPKLLAAYPSGTTSSANATFDGATLRRPDGSLLAHWIDVSDGERRGIAPVDSLAGHLHGSVAYNDGRQFPSWAQYLSKGDRIAFPVYRNKGESLGSLWQDAVRFIGAAYEHGLRVVLVGLAWNRINDLSDYDLEGCAAMTNDLAEQYSAVDGIVWFGLNRGTAQGWFKPEYQALVDSFSSPGLPAWEVPVAQGSVTITSYDPKGGTAPVNTRAVAAYTGDVKFFRWRYQKDGGAWNYGPVNPVSDVDNTFNFTDAGTYNIGVDGLDANQQAIPGAATGNARLITVVGGSGVKAKLDAVQAAFNSLRQELGQ